MKNRTYNRKKLLFVFAIAVLLILLLLGRLFYLMVFDVKHYGERAESLHERGREIKAARGEIQDRNGIVLATNQTVCTISVIHNQIQDPEKVIQVLSNALELPEKDVRKRVERVSAIERVQSNVDREIGERIREEHLQGVKVDEDLKRFYPYDTLASKVLGFTGGDNQGIIGLEVKYEEELKGKNGKILTVTDARGVELEEYGETRRESVAGNTLQLTLDANMQQFCQQAAEKVMIEKEAKAVSIMLMNPQNGEILAMVDAPEFHLQAPFWKEEKTELSDENAQKTEQKAKQKTNQEQLNQMWRNRCIHDTYEPGSTFKIITSSACLEEGIVQESDTFCCPGYRIVEDRRIRCHKAGGHGVETFAQGLQNSCNPVFMDLGLRLGAERFYDYFEQFGLLEKTGIDVPGEAGTIMHARENIGAVELATISFGQSFQITPVQMLTTVSSIINGGRRITPHFGKQLLDHDGNVLKKYSFPEKTGIVSNETSDIMCRLLEQVVSEGSGKNAYIEGYEIGGKTATSQTLPRSAHRYISSFIGFAPAKEPQVIGMIVIHEPQGIYYGGTIAAPVMRDIFDNILPYIGIEQKSEEKIEEKMP